jgi:hypothetical protein
MSEIQELTKALQALTPLAQLPAEDVQKKHDEVMAANEAAHRARTIAANRAEGFPEPKAGMRFFVSTAHGLKSRGRAGLVFLETPVAVAVVDLSGEELVAKQKAGEYVVDTWGTEQIFADSNQPGRRGLRVSMADPQALAPEPAAMSDAELEAAAAELERRRAAPAMMKGEERVGSTKKAAKAP